MSKKDKELDEALSSFRSDQPSDPGAEKRAREALGLPPKKARKKPPKARRKAKKVVTYLLYCASCRGLQSVSEPLPEVFFCPECLDHSEEHEVGGEG